MFEMLSYIFCCLWCCDCCPNGFDRKIAFDQRFYADRPSFKKYATEFDSIKNEKKESTEVSVKMVFEEIRIDKRKYRNHLEFYRIVLKLYDYEFIDKILGKGTFGEVYKVKDKKTNQFRAVKIMILKRLDEWNKNRFETFKREVFCLKNNPHKNIIKLFKHFIVNDIMSFMVMEFADRGDLKERLQQKHELNGRAFDEIESKTYFVQIAEAVHYVHSNRLFHGDLKLDNILIKTDFGGNEVLKVTDFGCANIAFDAKKGVVYKERAVGTVIYMSPEQLRVYLTVNLKNPKAFKYAITKYNPFKSDVWALGVCLYRLFFYDFPFVYNMNNEEKTLLIMYFQMKTGFKAPKHIIKDLSNDCMDLLKNLLEYNKDSRIDMKTVMNHKWVLKSIHKNLK